MATGEPEERRLSFGSDMALLEGTGARISGCWSLRSDRRYDVNGFFFSFFKLYILGVLRRYMEL